MDPIVNTVSAAVGNPAAGAVDNSAAAPQGGGSQFARIKAQLQETANSVGISMPSMAAPSPAQIVAMVQNTQHGTAAVGVVTERAKIENVLKVSRYHIDRIQTQVSANPQASALQKTITGRLTSIETQYNQLDVDLSRVSSNASPQDWLRLQQLANSMNENINVLSKLVDSAASGVKTILQTQI